MKKIIFNAQLKNSRKRIKSISGRLGEFIFRTYKDGKITAYYKPRKNRFPSGGHRGYYEVLSRLLRDIAAQFDLTITQINYDFHDEES